MAFVVFLKLRKIMLSVNNLGVMTVVSFFSQRFGKRKGCLTKRAADGGYAARFLGFFLALSFFRFEGESTLPPTAANAHRWAAKQFP